MVGFTSFQSGQFSRVAIVNLSDGKLVNLTSVQWQPHHWDAAAAALFYSSKSNQDCGLAGFTSRVGPALDSAKPPSTTVLFSVKSR